MHTDGIVGMLGILAFVEILEAVAAHLSSVVRNRSEFYPDLKFIHSSKSFHINLSNSVKSIAKEGN